MYPNAVIDAYYAQLALAGWSVGDVRGTLGWYVYGGNGENVVDAMAETQAEVLAAGVRAGADRRDAAGRELTGDCGADVTRNVPPPAPLCFVSAWKTKPPATGQRPRLRRAAVGAKGAIICRGNPGAILRHDTA
jgi:hypothetical protein